MSINTNNYNFVSLGYYGQKPKGCDYPEILTVAKPQSTPQEPETSIEKWKRYAWTVLPLLTLIRPVESIVTVITEIAKTAKSVDHPVKHRSLYSAFQTTLNIGTTVLPFLTLINPVGSITTVITEMAKTAKSVDHLVKHRSLYSAFQTALNIGTIAATLLEPLSPPLRTLFLGIQLLSLAHQTAVQVYRYNLDDRYDVRLDSGSKRDKIALYVISNLMAMASMVFQNSFVIFFFFLTQTVMTIGDALEQCYEGKYLSAGVNIVIATVRFFQTFQSFVNYMIVIRTVGFFQAFQCSVNCLINPREKIKEKLTAYETTLRNLGGEPFLYFKQYGRQEKFLILTSEADHNGAFYPSKYLYMIDKLSKRFDVKFRTITCVNDIQREIQTATQFGPVMGLMIQAHGNPFFMHLSDDPNTGLLKTQTISADTFAGLDPQCVIVLNSCATASVPYDGLAYRVAKLAKRVTYAANDIACGISLIKPDTLEFSFEQPDRSVKTIKIEPLESDSLRSN